MRIRKLSDTLFSLANFINNMITKYMMVNLGINLEFITKAPDIDAI